MAAIQDFGSFQGSVLHLRVSVLESVSDGDTVAMQTDDRSAFVS
jgi:hypothetical protein